VGKVGGSWKSFHLSLFLPWHDIKQFWLFPSTRSLSWTSTPYLAVITVIRNPFRPESFRKENIGILWGTDVILSETSPSQVGRLVKGERKGESTKPSSMSWSTFPFMAHPLPSPINQNVKSIMTPCVDYKAQKLYRQNVILTPLFNLSQTPMPKFWNILYFVKFDWNVLDKISDSPPRHCAGNCGRSEWFH